MLAAMGVKRAVAVGVIYDYILAIAVIFADGVYFAIGKGAYIFAGVCLKVSAVVVFDLFLNGVLTVTEARGGYAFYRACILKRQL